MTDPTVFYACVFLKRPDVEWVKFHFPHAVLKSRPCGTLEVYAAFPHNMVPEGHSLGRVCSAADYLYARDSDNHTKSALISDYVWWNPIWSERKERHRYWCKYVLPDDTGKFPEAALEKLSFPEYHVYERPSGIYEVYAVAPDCERGRSHLVGPYHSDWHELEEEEYTNLSYERGRREGSTIAGKYGIYVGIYLDTSVLKDVDSERGEIAYIRTLLPHLPRYCIIANLYAHWGDSVYWVVDGIVTSQTCWHSMGVENAFRDLPPLEDGALLGGACDEAYFRGAWPQSVAEQAVLEIATPPSNGEYTFINDGTKCRCDEMKAKPDEWLFRTTLPGAFGPSTIYMVAPAGTERAALTNFLAESHWYYIKESKIICSLTSGHEKDLMHDRALFSSRYE
jgi:hypothetical protein